MMHLFRTDAPHLRVFAPGRTELGGNHLDHQHGRVLAATIADGISMEACENESELIRLVSEGYDPLIVDIADLDPRENEENTSAALVRGMAFQMFERNIPLRGFDAKATSALPSGGGLSSSAAFEMALGCLMNTLFAKGKLDCATLAAMAQRTESDFFGKPCGLMDQTAIAYGGIVAIDLANPGKPLVETLSFDFDAAGYAICLVDVGCDHSRFTREYAQVPLDMHHVAAACGHQVLADVPEQSFMRELDRLRTDLGDLAVLRGLHFYRESELTTRRIDALRTGDVESFLRCTRASGASSAQYLQNVSCGGDYQPAMIALALADHLLDDAGAVRIHGGGFGGSIQAFVPHVCIERFMRGMNDHLGQGSCRILQLSDKGAHAEWM